VADVLVNTGLAILLIDLLTEEEEMIDRQTAEIRFDIRLLAERLGGVTDWLAGEPSTAALSIGYFGASTGAAAALIAGADRPRTVRAIVSRGGRPDLAVKELGGIKRLVIIPGATHLFEEPGALEQVAALASEWFLRYLDEVP
jgi:dienelactone hydrolase